MGKHPDDPLSQDYILARHMEFHEKPEIEICSVSEFPSEITGGDLPLCVGTTDGRVLFKSLNNYYVKRPVFSLPSQEAINGIAFSDGLMAVSSRDDLEICKYINSETLYESIASFGGGSHGVVAMPNGGFVAPIGIDGLAIFSKTNGDSYVASTASLGRYIYKVASIGKAKPEEDLPGGDLFACASRRDGITLALKPTDGTSWRFNRLTNNNDNFDIIDVCNIASSEYPLAAAALSSDGRIYLFDNVVTPTRQRSFRIQWQSERELYKILCWHGHVFLLSSVSVFCILGLASDFLGGKTLNISDYVIDMNVKSITIELIYDFILASVLPKDVWLFDLDLLSRDDGMGGASPGPHPIRIAVSAHPEPASSWDVTRVSAQTSFAEPSAP